MPKPVSGALASVGRWPLLVLCCSLFTHAALALPQSATTPQSVRALVGWPLFFEPAPAPAGNPPFFVARGPNYQLAVAPAEVQFALRRMERTSVNGSVRRDPAAFSGSVSTHLVRMTFTGAQAQARLSGVDELEGKINYLVGNQHSSWRTQVATYGKVQVQGLYPGIDLVYYGDQRQLEYDFRIAPRADPASIALRFDGVDRLAIGQSGELVLGVGQGEMRQHKPALYQIVRGARQEVAGAYRLQDSHTVTFIVGQYDHDTPLIIDPVFSYASYFGGNGGDTGLAIKVDTNGSVYLAGETLSTQFQSGLVTNVLQSTFHGGTVTGDAFVAKLDSTGSKLIYFTYLGGASDDGALDLALDRTGNVYITGFTESGDFPTQNPLFGQIIGTLDPTFHIYPTDAFVAELNTNGTALVFSTYLGGTDKDLGSAIAVDPAGNTYVTGYTFSTNFPVANALQGALQGNDDAFVAKIAPAGASLLYSTYLGGLGTDEGEGIAANAAGFAFVAGYTASANFPITTNASQTNLNGSGVVVSVFDAFVSKIAPDGSALDYSTYLGGSLNDYGYRIAVDASDNAYVTGTTQSPDFPQTNSFNLGIGENGTNVVNFDAFLTKLDAHGARSYSAQFGGTRDDAGWDVAVDPSGRAFVVGITFSTNFPVANPFDLFRATNSGGKDIFVVAFETNAAGVLYSAYLGGTNDDYGYGIAVDAEANAYITGMTLSGGFPTTPGAFQTSLSGISDAFLAKIRLLDPMLTLKSSGGLLQISWPATAPDFLLQSTTSLGVPSPWTLVPQAPTLNNGQYFVTLTPTNSSALFRLDRP